MIRGAVVGLINNKSLSQQSNAHDDGRAVTLMSTDAESVEQAASMFHETWAQVVEVALGMAMLARQVGWAFPVPLIIIFCELLGPSPSAQHQAANILRSLLQNESISGQKPPGHAKGLDGGYPETHRHDHIHACFHEEFEDARHRSVLGISGQRLADSRAIQGYEGAVDDGCLQCKL